MYTGIQCTCIVIHSRCVVVQEILDAGVDYVKILTEGHFVPSAEVQKR